MQSLSDRLRAKSLKITAVYRSKKSSVFLAAVTQTARTDPVGRNLAPNTARGGSFRGFLRMDLGRGERFTPLRGLALDP